MKALTAALLTMTLALPSLAMSDVAENQMLLSEATISLTKAIENAEKHLGGQAVSAEVERSLGGVVFDVEVLRGSQMYDVRIDGKNGQVLDAREDRD